MKRAFVFLIVFYGIIFNNFNAIGQNQPTLNHSEQPTDFNIIPKNPHTAELGKFGHQGVNEATGTPNINITLYTLEEDGVSVPITLSYNATGIKTDDITGEVGLKWSLSAGGQCLEQSEVCLMKILPDG